MFVMYDDVSVRGDSAVPLNSPSKPTNSFASRSVRAASASLECDDSVDMYAASISFTVCKVAGHARVCE
jgi:hypothetical protein